MAALNQELADAWIGHATYVERYGVSVAQKVIGLLNRTDADLVQQISSRLQKITDRGFDTGPATTRRLQDVLNAVRAVNQAAYKSIGGTLTTELSDFAAYEAQWAAASIDKVLPAAVSFSTPPVRAVVAAAMSRPFQGRLLKESLDGLEASRAARIRDAIRIGVVEGQTTDQIVRRIRGTRAASYADGLLETDRRGAYTMARTAVAHVSNAARESTFVDNKDLISKVQWHATLDGKTCLICGSRDGSTYPIGSGPRPPAHYNCRCTAIPVIKSWRELGIDVDEMPASTRASMNGQVPANQTYAEWLGKQSQTMQDDILGKDKGALFRTGGLPVEKFVDKVGNELTLDELKAAAPTEYSKAGLDNPIRPPRGVPQDGIAKFLDDDQAQLTLLNDLYEGQGMDFDGQMDTVREVKENEGWYAADEDLAALRFNTSNGYLAISRRMNAGIGTLEDRKLVALAARGIDDLPQFEDPIWRAPTKRQVSADRWWEKAVIGQELDLGNQLQSFSSNQEFASGWASNSDVLLTIERPGRGAYIEPLTVNTGEHEVVLPPGLKYRVAQKGYQVINGKRFRVIALEVVDGG